MQASPYSQAPLSYAMPTTGYAVQAAKATISDGPAEVPATKEALQAELSNPEYADWVEGVMEREKPRPDSPKNWVWNCPQLGKVLEKDNPRRWAVLNAGIAAYGWQALPLVHKHRFVHTGEQDGEDYVHIRVYPTLEDIMPTVSEEERSIPFYCAICYYVGTFLGLLLNVWWCCCGYVVPNWCFAWRWPCCQAPWSCCFRSYWDFDEIEPEIETGDVFLFCGDNMTRFGGQSHWSHAGIALRDDTGIVGPKGILYLFEANFGRPGWDHCDLRILREKVLTYKKGTTDCCFRKLIATDEQRDLCAKAIVKHCGCAYDHDLMHMTAAAIDFCPCFEVGAKSQKTQMFCSEAVANILQVAGVLAAPPDGPPPEEYLPRDFGARFPIGMNSESRRVNEVMGDSKMIQRADPGKWTALQGH